MFRYFSIFTSRFSLHSRFLLPTSTRNFSPFAEKLTQESKNALLQYVSGFFRGIGGMDFTF